MFENYISLLRKFILDSRMFFFIGLSYVELLKRPFLLIFIIKKYIYLKTYKYLKVILVYLKKIILENNIF